MGSPRSQRDREGEPGPGAHPAGKENLGGAGSRRVTRRGLAEGVRVAPAPVQIRSEFYGNRTCGDLLAKSGGNVLQEVSYLLRVRVLGCRLLHAQQHVLGLLESVKLLVGTGQMVERDR